MNSIFENPAAPMERRFLLYAALLSIGLAGACTADARVKPPQDAAAYATQRSSAQDAFRVSYRTEGPVPVGRLHAWTLQVTHRDGSPVTDALIAVDGDMPEHGHGLPTRPRVTRHLGNGEYLLEGVKFQMGGWWVMDFDITAGGRMERVRFNLLLKK